MRIPFWSKIWKKRGRRKIEKTTDSEPYFTEIGIPEMNNKKIKIPVLRIISRISLYFLLFITSCCLIGLAVLILIAKDLPHPQTIVRKEGFATKIFDRNGKLIYEVFQNQKRTPIQLYEVSPYIREATVSIEDKEFYSHKGFDPKGYLRIVYYLIFKHRLIGGSTLTQQLVKNVLLSPEKTPIRKLKELILALEIEAKYSKDQILQMYLNEVPYGGTTWGIEEAAKTYFNKSASELDLTQSAILAGLPQIPSYYSPFGNNPKAYIDRSKTVLRRMQEDGKITKEEEEKSISELDDINFASQSGTFKAPHFVMYIKKLLEDKYGEKEVELGGLRVYTTLDIDLQEKAQKIVAEEIAKTEKMHITNGGSVVMDPNDGEILAMVGSKNYDDPDYDGKVNVTLSLRQPGSAIKPITYLTGLKKGYTASTLLMDTDTAFPQGVNKPDYIPVNYDGKEHGPVQVRYALGNSLNIPAVKMLSLVGIKDMLTVASDLGLTTLEPTDDNLKRFGLSVTLGGGEVRLIDLVTAYSTFANGGKKVEPIAILKVTDKDGNILEEYKPVDGEQIISPGEAFIISNLLSDNSARVMTFGENSLLKFTDRQVAVKTGTTNDKRDNWTIGWTPQIIAGVWVGNNDNTQMKTVASGVSGSSPIWRKIILSSLEGKAKEDFKVPEEVISVEVDSVSGYRNHDGFPLRTEYFIKGTEPNSDDPLHLKLKLCKSEGKLATPVDIARGDYDEREYFVFKEIDPFFNQGNVNRWQIGIDNWVSKQTDQRYNPPKEYCNTESQVYVKFINPQDQTTVNGQINIKVETTTADEIVRLEIFADGQSKAVLTSVPYEINLTLPEGRHTIRAVAIDSKGNQGSQESRIGVNVPWDYNPSPTSSPVPTNIPDLSTPTP